VPTIQRHLLAIVDQPRMLEPEFALQSRFIGNVFAKWWCEGAHDVCRDLNKERHEEEAFTADATGETIIVDDNVEYGLGKVRVEFGERVGEFGNVNGYKLVCILYAVVEC
jgi:hypothetical protein